MQKITVHAPTKYSNMSPMDLENLLSREMLNGNTGIIHVNHNHQLIIHHKPVLEQPAFTRVEGLNSQQQELMENMIDDYIFETKLCPKEYWTTPTKKTDKTKNYMLRREKDDPQTQNKKDKPQTKSMTHKHQRKVEKQIMRRKIIKRRQEGPQQYGQDQKHRHLEQQQLQHPKEQQY
jgi:hypothetical protein